MDQTCKRLSTLIISLKSNFKQLSNELEISTSLGVYNRSKLVSLRDLVKSQISEIIQITHWEIKATTREGKEVAIEIKERIAYWNDFYKKYDIRDIDGNLVQINEEDFVLPTAEIMRATKDVTKYSFDSAIIIPPRVTFGEIRQKLVIKDDLAGYARTGIVTSRGIDNENLFAIISADKPILFLYEKAQQAKPTKPEGDSADDLKALFEKENLTGFGLIEYFIFLRDWVNQLGRPTWSSTDKVPDRGNATCLLKTFQTEEDKKRNPENFSKDPRAGCLYVRYDSPSQYLHLAEVMASSRSEGRSWGRFAGSYAP